MANTPSTVTPYRQTRVIFDLAEPAVQEMPYAQSRYGSQIARQGIGPNNSQNVERLATGAWALKPFQSQQGTLTERSDAADAIIPQSGFTLTQGYVTQNRTRKNDDLQGATFGSLVQATGNPFLVRHIPAGQSWAAEDMASDLTSFGQPTLPTINAPMDRHGVGNVTYPADQPYYLRFETPGTGMHAPDWYKTFYFGGPIQTQGFGEYALSFSGDGFAMLFVRVNLASSGGWQFIPVDAWRYCEPARAMNATHSIRIWPHSSGTNKYLEFLSATVSHAPTSERLQLPSLYPPGTIQDRHVYHPAQFKLIQELAAIAIAEIDAAIKFQNMTGAGPVRFDMRRDQRVRAQFSLLRFPKSGYLIDLPLGIAFAITQNLTLSWKATLPDDCTLTGKLYDATTRAELTLVSTTANSATYEPNPGQPNYFARFDFGSNSDQSATPLLWGYTLQKDGVIATNAPAESIPTYVTSVNISGPESDPSHESASLAIEDPGNHLTTLLTKAAQRTRIQTAYDPTDPTLYSVLFDGRAERNVATRKGTKKKEGLGGQGAYRLAPSDLWRRYDCQLLGMWARLSQMMSFVRLPLGEDPSAPRDPMFPDLPVPYKVTDILRLAFEYAGFTSDMIDVSDSPIRFWASGKDSMDDMMLDPLQSIGEQIVKWAREYLGWFVIWDGNAGLYGMWRVRPPSIAPYTNLWEFVTDGPTAGKAAHRPESYGTPNWVGYQGKAFIQKGTLQTYVKRPEANAILVVSTGEPMTADGGALKLSQWAVNCASLYDSTSPDYLGAFIPLVIVDNSLPTKEARDWVTRRYFDFVCHAVKMATFTAPLVLVTDPADTLQARPRPLRYYDPVLIDGEQWLVRNCNPNYVKDGIQMAYYECEAPRSSPACG